MTIFFAYFQKWLLEAFNFKGGKWEKKQFENTEECLIGE